MNFVTLVALEIVADKICGLREIFVGGPLSQNFKGMLIKKKREKCIKVPQNSGTNSTIGNRALVH